MGAAPGTDGRAGGRRRRGNLAAQMAMDTLDLLQFH
jgi:hypothetical protein